MNSKTKIDDTVLDSDIVDELLNSVTPLSPPPGLRMKVLARALGPNVLSDSFTVRQDAPWRDLRPGIQFKLLAFDTVAATKSFLLRADAGARLPAHSHTATEECLVLAGEFNIGDLRLCAGDFHCMGGGTAHKEAFTANGVTVYIRASSHDYPGIHP